MKKTNKLLILVLLITVCVACQEEIPLSPTETPIPPTETLIPPTPTPNPNTEGAFLAFCKAAVEGNLEDALQLVTEDIEIIYTGGEDVTYKATLQGYSGVEELLKNYAEWEVFDCNVRRFVYNGDEVSLWWTESSPYGGYTVHASCKCNGTMQGDKIHKIVNDCIYEYWPKDTN